MRLMQHPVPSRSIDSFLGALRHKSVAPAACEAVAVSWQEFLHDAREDPVQNSHTKAYGDICGISHGLHLGHQLRPCASYRCCGRRFPMSDKTLAPPLKV